MLTFNLMILLNKNISNKSTKLGVENKARGEVFFTLNVHEMKAET